MLLLNESYLHSSLVDCSLCFFAVADLKDELQALRDKLAEKRQQARAPTLVPPPGLPVPTVLPGQQAPRPCSWGTTPPVQQAKPLLPLLMAH